MCCRLPNEENNSLFPCPGKGGARMRADRAAAIHAPATAAAVCMGPREPPSPPNQTATPHAPPPLPSLLLRLQGQSSREQPFVPSSSVVASATAGARCPSMPKHHALPRSGEGRDGLPRGGGARGGASSRSSRTPQQYLFVLVMDGTPPARILSFSNVYQLLAPLNIRGFPWFEGVVFR